MNPSWWIEDDRLLWVFRGECTPHKYTPEYGSSLERDFSSRRVER